MAQRPPSAGKFPDGSREYPSTEMDETFFRTIAGLAPTGIVVVNSSLSIEYANEMAETTLGRTNTSLVGENLSELVHRDEGHDMKALRMSLEEGSPTMEEITIECRHKETSNPHSVEMCVRTITHEGDRHGVAVVREGPANAVQEPDLQRKVRESGGPAPEDAAVEIEVHLAGNSHPLFDHSRVSSCHISVEGFVSHSNGSLRVFFSRSSDSPGDIPQVKESSKAIDSIRCVAERDGMELFEAVVTGSTIESMLLTHGAAIKSVDIEGDITVIAEVPQRVDLLAVLNRVQSRWPEAKLVGPRPLDPLHRTRTDFRNMFEDHLTPRQKEILRVSYLSGFFEWPRVSTGEEVAGSLGISGAAFSRLLRTGQRKCLELLYDEQ